MSSSERDERIAFRRFARVEINSANVYLVSTNKQKRFKNVEYHFYVYWSRALAKAMLEK